MARQHVLITGAAGRIGRVLCAGLRDRDAVQLVWRGIEAEGRSDLVNELIAASGEKARSPLDELVQNALQSDLLAMEDDALGELNALHGRLTSALEFVENAIRSVEQ